MAMIDRVLLGLLVVSILFHALALRFDVVRLDDTAGFRINRLTGEISICVASAQPAVVLCVRE